MGTKADEVEAMDEGVPGAQVKKKAPKPGKKKFDPKQAEAQVRALRNQAHGDFD